MHPFFNPFSHPATRSPARRTRAAITLITFATLLVGCDGEVDHQGIAPNSNPTGLPFCIEQLHQQGPSPVADPEGVHQFLNDVKVHTGRPNFEKGLMDPERFDLFVSYENNENFVKYADSRDDPAITDAWREKFVAVLHDRATLDFSVLRVIDLESGYPICWFFNHDCVVAFCPNQRLVMIFGYYSLMEQRARQGITPVNYDRYQVARLTDKGAANIETLIAELNVIELTLKK